MIRLFSKGIPIKPANCGTFRNLFLNYELPSTVMKNSFPKTSFHSSCYQLNEIHTEDPSVVEIQKPVRLSSAQARKIAYMTVDWLPFPWTRRTYRSSFEFSGEKFFVVELIIY